MLCLWRVAMIVRAHTKHSNTSTANMNAELSTLTNSRALLKSSVLKLSLSPYFSSGLSHILRELLRTSLTMCDTSPRRPRWFFFLIFVIFSKSMTTSLLMFSRRVDIKSSFIPELDVQCRGRGSEQSLLKYEVREVRTKEKSKQMDILCSFALTFSQKFRLIFMPSERECSKLSVQAFTSSFRS